MKTPYRRLAMLLVALILCLAAFFCSKDKQATQEQDATGPPVGLTPVIQPNDEPGPAPSAKGSVAVQAAARPAPGISEDKSQSQGAPESKQAGPTPLDGSRQAVVVITGGWKDFRGKMLRLSRPNPAAPWSLVESRWPCVVGKNGLAWGRGVFPQKPDEPAKREGDGKSPAGVFKLGDMFGSENSKLVKTLGLKMPYLKLEQTHICVNDPASSSFNRIIDAANAAKPDFKHFERMLRSDKANRWGVFIEHNPAPITPDAGSCVFLNIWSSPALASGGSTGISEPDMRELVLWLDPSAKPLLVQMPAKELAKLKDAWRLPPGLVQ